MAHSSRLAAGAVLAAAWLTSVAIPAAAKDHKPTSTTTTTSTTASTTSTTASSTTTTSTTSRSTSSTTTATTAPMTTTSTAVPAPELVPVPPGEVPPEVQAMIDAYPRTPAGSTDALVEALASLPPRVARSGFGRFPVAGTARWNHDWLFPRFVPSFHVHEGTDVFARRGTPVHSPAAGTARVSNGVIGGLAVRVVQPDGTFWYLAHLEDARVRDGQEVQPGSVVGTVGDSGNAIGGPPHVHIEVHPHGGGALDPKPLLDQYYAEALATAPLVVASYEARARVVADRLEPLPEEVVAMVTAARTGIDADERARRQGTDFCLVDLLPGESTGATDVDRCLGAGDDRESRPRSRAERSGGELGRRG